MRRTHSCLQVQAPTSQLPSSPDYIKLATKALHSAQLSPQAKAAVSRQLETLIASTNNKGKDEANGLMRMQLDASQPGSQGQHPNGALHDTNPGISKDTDSTQHSPPSQQQASKLHTVMHTDESDIAADAALQKQQAQHSASTAAEWQKHKDRYTEQPSMAGAHVASDKPDPQSAKHSSGLRRAGYQQKLHGVRPLDGSWQARIKRNGFRKPLGMYTTGVS